MSDSIGGAALTASDDERPHHDPGDPGDPRDPGEPGDPGDPGTPGEPEGGGGAASVFALVREVVVVLVVALALSLLIKTFLVQAFFIPSQSMEATLVPGDRVLVSKLTPGPFSLKHGDVVVFADPGNWLPPVVPTDDGRVRDGLRTALTFVGLLPEDSNQHLVKRLIGLPGDTVACCDSQGKVTVNGKPIDETYLYPGDDPAGDPTGDTKNRRYSIVVPAGHIWVLGDHRSDSSDSRFHRTVDNGLVPISDVVGKAFVKIWPLNRFGTIPNPCRDHVATPPRSGRKKVVKPLPTVPPSLREERKLLRSGHTLLAAIDEVGRGALAGPVTVGVVVVDLDTGSAPTGVRDSKLLTPPARQALVPRLRRWAPAHAVGHASSCEIDRIGIIAALRLAACRALATLEVRPDCALLDGSHNWLSIPLPRSAVAATDADESVALFEMDVPPEPEPDPTAAEVRVDVVPPRVVTQIKADMRCAAVAAASVLAKVERDAIMVALAEQYPEYHWHENKGYSAPEHRAALRRLGPCELHRRSWNLLSGAFKESDDELDDEVDVDQLDVDQLDVDQLDVDQLDADEVAELIELSQAEGGSLDSFSRADR